MARFFKEVDGVQHFIPAEERLSVFELYLFYRGKAEWHSEQRKKMQIRYEKRIANGTDQHVLRSDEMELKRLEKEWIDALAKAQTYLAEANKPFVGKIVTFVKGYSGDHDAEVTHVWTPDCVNLKVLTEKPHEVTSVMHKRYFENQGAAGHFWHEKYEDG